MNWDFNAVSNRAELYSITKPPLGFSPRFLTLSFSQLFATCVVGASHFLIITLFTKDSDL